jgi:urate oxidase
MDYTISYGKRRVPVYRVHAAPLTGVRPIPESPFTGRANEVFALEVDVDVLGGDFLAAYTRGDNTGLVATDSMKNFILRQALIYDGATIEGFLAFLGRGFLATYPQVRSLRLSGREMPFVAAPVPDGRGGFAQSEVLFDRVDADYAAAALDLHAGEDGATVTGHQCSRIGVRLLKTTGSAFTSFVRDGYTTLPDRRDRPLFITLDVDWRYGDVADLLGRDPARYVPAEQVRDLIRTVFHEFVSESIQHLVHEFGRRLLDRFPQLVEVGFRAENRTRDPYGESDADPRIRVYSDPFPAYGEITLRIRRTSTDGTWDG